MPTVFILLGPPGAGKGTQAVRLSAALALPHVSTGDLFRENLGKGTELGIKAKGFMESGRLVPDDVVIDMLFERVSKPDCKSGFLLDGFPRTVAQAAALDRRLAGWTVRAPSINVPDSALVERLAGRATCKACGHVHHLRFSPPKVAGRCDRCAGELYQRPDDSREVVSKRLSVYREQTKPVEDHYNQLGVLSVVDGDRSPDDVFTSLLRATRGEQS